MSPKKIMLSFITYYYFNSSYMSSGILHLAGQMCKKPGDAEARMRGDKKTVKKRAARGQPFRRTILRSRLPVAAHRRVERYRCRFG